MKKILICTPIYYIEGRQNLFHDSSAVHYLVKPWADKYDVRVILLYTQTIKNIVRYKDKKEREYYKKGYHYSIDGVKVSMCEIQRHFKQPPILDFFQAKRFANFIKKNTEEDGFIPDIIVTHIPVMMVHAIKDVFKNVPKIAVLHQTDLTYCNKKPELVNLLNSNFGCFYARSKAIYNKFSEKPLKNLKDQIIYSGIPYLVDFKREINIKDKINILYVGKLIKRKNIDLVIKALSRLGDKYNYSLLIYGEGKERENLERLASELLDSSRYKFYDYIPREEVFEKMREAQIFIMPSVRETLGLVYLEAMAQGCIVIGTQDEGIDGIIQNNVNGFLVKKDNILVDLTNILIKIFEMKEDEIKSISSYAQQTASMYNEKNIGEKYLEAILKGVN